MLRQLPRVLHPPIRAVRTVALAAFGPIDKLHRRVLGQSTLPPLWLRRHVGPLGGFDRSVGEISATIALLELVRPGDSVMDLGCGVAAMVPDLLRAVGPSGRYVGFDVHAPSITWCQRQFRAEPRVRFVLAKIQSVYSALQSAEANRYVFPAESESIDFAVAKSLFTHLEEDVATQYLSELARVLRPGGHALVSAFLLGIGTPSQSSTPKYDFAYGNNRVRWLMEHRPAAGIAFARDTFLELCAGSGLEVERILYGYWRGNDGPAPNAQDLIVLRRNGPGQIVGQINTKMP
jgi:ubiquinone/menaquinone biosynthesis C-methylase UbiE